MSTIGIMCIGVTMVIITGGIDLSVGSLLAVTGMFTARLMYFGDHPWVCVGVRVRPGIRRSARSTGS